jgi:hypothetical protein
VAVGFTNSGTLTATGTLNATAGGLNNTGTVNAQGLISGNIVNIGPGTFTVTGLLSAGRQRIGPRKWVPRPQLASRILVAFGFELKVV